MGPTCWAKPGCFCFQVWGCPGLICELNWAGSLGHRDALPGLGSVEGSVPPGQVVAVDPDLGENGTLVYSIQPPNKFYSLNSTTGKIRTTHVMLDRENPDPLEAELMRKIIVSVTDCMCPHTPGSPQAWAVRLDTKGPRDLPSDLSPRGPEAHSRGLCLDHKKGVTSQGRGVQGL